MGKRLFDLAAAGVALLLLAPLFVVLALLIKLDSPGPVFFRQERVGRGGRPFAIHKFRTMVADAPERGGPLTIGADPRITRVGRWLRDRRLDELPQFIDVLRGEMSLVGPRPEVPRYVAHYPPALREAVLSVRPGITDPASLAFVDEARLLSTAADPERTYIDEVLPQKLRISADYARHAGLRADLAVLWRTVMFLLGRRGTA